MALRACCCLAFFKRDSECPGHMAAPATFQVGAFAILVVLPCAPSLKGGHGSCVALAAAAVCPEHTRIEKSK